MPELGSEAKWDEGQRRRGSAFIISMCKGPGGRVSHEAQGRTPAGQMYPGELMSSLARGLW